MNAEIVIPLHRTPCYVTTRPLPSGKTAWVASIPEIGVTIRGVHLERRQDNKRRRAWTFYPHAAIR